jgi:predicted metalloprotease with PDZ domain
MPKAKPRATPARKSTSAPGRRWDGPVENATPPPRDAPWPGVLRIHVDAGDPSQGIFRVHETVPVTPGELTLLYPKWLPGNHSPTGPIDKLAGLAFRAGSQPLAWRRSQYDVYAFTVDVPAGVKEIEVAFEYLSARNPGEGPVEMTADMLDLVWSKTSLYPAEHYTRGITCVASVALPAGWGFGTALEQDARKGNTTTFAATTYDVLVDSPIYAGRYFKRVDLAPKAKVPVHLAIVADAPKYLEITDAQLQAHRNLVTQAKRLFASQHYGHYDFLLSLSDTLSPKGLEHQESSEDGVFADYFTNWKHGAARRDLLAHEYAHSWNGKFRRPTDLWTPNFNVPMGGSLLWVYEGQTQYWGFVLTARAGLWSADEFRDALAQVAARYDRGRPGFAWRTLADTTRDPVIARRAALAYRNWQMSEEYYSAGQLLWLGVDAKLRGLTAGKASLDAFAARFFGVGNGSRTTRTYVFEDVVATLDAVAKYRWAAFLRTRLAAARPPLDGLKAAGWKLVYTDVESELEKQLAHRYHRQASFLYSLGIALGRDGRIGDVRWDGPAFKAGVGSGETLIAVNGQAYRPEVLTDALKAARATRSPTTLLLKYQDRYRSVAIDYRGGPQHPHLVRIDAATDHLSAIIRPR